MNARGMAADRHIPVLRDRIVELLAPALTAPGAVYLDGTLGHGRARRGDPRALPARARRGHRPRPGGAGARRRAPRAVCRAGHLRARGLRRGAAGPRRGRGRPRGRRPLRPRASPRCSSTRPTAASPTARTPRSTCGWTRPRGSPPPRCSTPTTRPTSSGAARVRRGAVRPQDRRRPSSASASVEPFTTSGRLVDLLKKVVPAASQKSGGHPGKRTFQALRIEVNAELSVWAAALPRAIDALAVGGRIAVLSYHSLEDRITKRVLAAGARAAAPQGLPVELPEHAAYLRLLTRGAEEASAEEQAANPRSASVRLRAAERTRPLRHPTSQHHEGNAPMSQQTATARVASRAPAPAGSRPRSRCASSRPPSGHPGNGVFAALCMTLLVRAGCSGCSCSTRRWPRARSPCTTCSPPPASSPTPRTP